MDNLMDNLTTTEAAVAAGVSLPQVNRVIDDRILPDDWYSTSPTRTVRTDACLLISFYFETADLLTAGTRLQIIRNAVAHDHTWEQWKDPGRYHRLPGISSPKRRIKAYLPSAFAHSVC